MTAVTADRRSFAVVIDQSQPTRMVNLRGGYDVVTGTLGG